jgi:putative membrane protein
MTTEIFLRYIHFISIFAIVGSLVAEHLLIKKTMTRSEIGRLAKIDAVYGLSALTLLAAGLTLWLGSYGKPAVYYNHNWVFHSKLGLVALLAIASIYPTAFFLKQRKGKPDETVEIPGKLIMLLRLELALLAIIPLVAGLMARGIGYNYTP